MWIDWFVQHYYYSYIITVNLTSQQFEFFFGLSESLPLGWSGYLSMDPSCSGQDVLRCDVCETPVAQLHCDICHINLCKPCVGEHVIDETKERKVVPFKKRGSTLKCLKHSTKICEIFCMRCQVPICALCVSSLEHTTH